MTDEIPINYSELLKTNSESEVNLTNIKYPFIMIDCLNNIVIAENNPHKKTSPSSMTKVMTLILLFSAIKDNVLSNDSMVNISKESAKKSGSKMFLKAGDKVAVSDLIEGVAICSGNDAAYVIAEAVSGSVESFVAEMNYKGQLLNLQNTHFKNPSGWPDKEHYSTVYDLAMLALYMIKHFPEYYPVFSKRSIRYNGILQYNYNRLLRQGIGVDGIKTGHTDKGGYGIIVSSKNSFGRRILLVINECPKEGARDKIAKNLLRIGFQNFDNYIILKKDATAAKIKVWLGEQGNVKAISKKDIILTMNKKNIKNLKVSVVFEEPIKAPIQEGAKIATLIISNNETGTKLTYPLYAASSVQEVSYLTKIKRILEFLVFGL